MRVNSNAKRFANNELNNSQFTEGVADLNGRRGSSEETIMNGDTRIIDLTISQFNLLLKGVIESTPQKKAPTLAELENEDMITRDEAKALIKCQYPKLHRLMKDGDISFWKAGHRTIISRTSVLNYIKGAN